MSFDQEPDAPLHGECAAEIENLNARLSAAIAALEEIAFAGTSRPREMGEGDDGDGHFRNIALRAIGVAARALKEVRG